MDSANTAKLVGRTIELARIADPVQRSLSGKGSVVTVVGEPGIGKTALARVASEQFATDGGVVVWGRSVHSNGSTPFDPWIEIIRSLRSKLANLPDHDVPDVIKLIVSSSPGDNRHSQAQTDQQEIFRGIEEFVHLCARTQPICVVLDDLHWADATGTKLFEYLAKGCDESPILILGTYRDSELTLSHPLSRVAANLLPEPHHSQIKLSRLSDEHSLDLWNSVTGLPAVSDRKIVEPARGNPLFIVELARSVEPSRPIEGAPSYSSIQDAVSRHLLSLDDSAIDILKTSALRDTDWSVSEATSLFSEPEPALRAWDQAEQIGLLEKSPESSGALRFKHPLIREVLLSDMTAVDKAIRHSKIAESLEPNIADSASKAHVLAHHFSEAIPITGVTKAIHYLSIAANYAHTIKAYETAHTMYGRLLELIDGEVFDENQADANAGFAVTGLFAASGRRRSVVVEPLRKAFDYYIEHGMLDKALSLAVIPYTGEDSTREATHYVVGRAMEFADEANAFSGRIIANMGIVHYYQTGEFDLCMKYLNESLSLAEKHGDDQLRALVLKNITNIRHFHNKFDETDADLVDSAISAARKIGDHLSESTTTRTAAMDSLRRGDIDAAAKYANECLAAATASRNTSATTYGWDTVATVAEVAGDWHRFYEASNRAISMDPGNTPVMENRIRTEEFRGNYQYVDEQLGKMADRLPTLNGLFDHVNTAQSYLHAAERNPDYSRTAQKILSADPAGTDAPLRLTAHLKLFRALAAKGLGRGEVVEEMLAWFDANPGSEDDDWFAKCTIAQLRSSVGRHDEAVKSISPLVEGSKGSRSTINAYVLITAARVFTARNDVDDLRLASDLLDSAEVLCEEFGLDGLLESAKNSRAEVRSAITSTKRSDGLTERELEILALVAKGKTNREIAEEFFISRHTVVRHTSNIFRKINVKNRSQAASYAFEQGIAKVP